MRSLLMRTTAAGLLSLAALSCASVQLSEDEEATLRQAMETPLSLVVPRERALPAWDRAVEFVDRFSSMKLRTVSDSVLVTYETPTYQQVPVPVEPGSSIRYGYSISRSRDPEGVRISVQCTPSSKLGEKDADQNAHIAAYYIMTGQVACDRCIVR